MIRIRRKRLLPIALAVVLLVGAATAGILVLERQRKVSIAIASRFLDRTSYVDLLLHYMAHANSRAQDYAAQQLVALGLPAVPDIVECARRRSSDAAFREKAATAIGRLGEPAAQALRERFSSADRDTQRTIVFLFGSASARVMGSFLDDQDPLLSADVADLLVESGAESLPLFEKLLKDKSGPKRWWAAASMGRLGRSGKLDDARAAAAAAAVEQTLLFDKEIPVRMAAADALGDFGPAAEKSLVSLMAALNDADPDLRAAAVRAIGRIGTTDADNLVAVVDALRDEDDGVSRAAREALRRLQSTSSK